MMAVEEFDDMEPAFVDIEMDIPGLEAGSTGLPDFCFRIQAFNFLPGRIADAFAVRPGMDKQQFQLIVLGRFVDLQDQTADCFAVFTDNSRMNCSRSSSVSRVRVMSAIKRSSFVQVPLAGLARHARVAVRQLLPCDPLRSSHEHERNGDL